MCSVIYVLLSVYFVAVSSEKAVVYVKDVKDGYKELKFSDGAQATKSFTLAKVTEGDQVKVDNQFIKETELAVGFVAKSATIPGVNVAKITQAVAAFDASGCTAAPCMMPTSIGADTYKIRITGINALQTTMTCKDTTETAKTYTLNRAGVTGKGIIPVTANAINTDSTQLDANLQSCEIDAFVLEQIDITEKNDCSIDATENCFKNTAFFNYSFKLSLFLTYLVIGKML